jgi:hypothetical protein
MYETRTKFLFEECERRDQLWHTCIGMGIILKRISEIPLSEDTSDWQGVEYTVFDLRVP